MKIWTIALFEFKRYFKWKQELMSLGLMALIFALTSLWPVLKNALDKDYQVAIVSTAAKLPQLAGFQFQPLNPSHQADAVKGLGQVWHAVVVADATSLQVTYHEKASWQGRLNSSLQSWQ